MDERLAEADVLLAEPDRRVERLQRVVQLLRGTLPIVLGVPEEEVAALGVGHRLLLGLAANGVERAPFGGGVRH